MAPDGPASLRIRSPDLGMSPVEDRGCGPRPDRGPVWLGREGPGNGSSQKCKGPLEKTVLTEPSTP